jgi:group I intron endonuclease
MNNNKENNNVNIIPVVKYANLGLDKSFIFRENINKSGVYRLVNNINGKSHVGSSRYLSHSFSIYYSLDDLRKVKGSIIIYRALLKYGHSNFSLDILEYCECSILIQREQYYIDLLKPKYNIKIINPKS